MNYAAGVFLTKDETAGEDKEGKRGSSGFMNTCKLTFLLSQTVKDVSTLAVVFLKYLKKQT